MTDWNIQTRAPGCHECGRAFSDQEPYHTLLFEDGVTYLRRDVCVPCWLRQADGPGTEVSRAISHWQGVYVMPAPAAELIRKDTAETLLGKLLERDDPRYLAPLFILAVMLERKRLLKVRDQVVREGRKTLFYERPKTGEVLAITDPELSMGQLDQVQRDVSRLLEHGISEPEQPPAPGSEAPQPTPPLADAAETDGPGRD